MVNDGLIKLNSTEINKLGNGNGGNRAWLDEIKITAAYIETAKFHLNQTTIENMVHNETYGNGNNIAGGDINMQLQEKIKENEILVKSNSELDNKLKQSQINLTIAQTKDINNRWKYTAAGAILGLIIAYFKHRLIG